MLRRFVRARKARLLAAQEAAAATAKVAAAKATAQPVAAGAEAEQKVEGGVHQHQQQKQQHLQRVEPQSKSSLSQSPVLKARELTIASVVNAKIRLKVGR
jgi:hypothetical protein